MFDKNILLNKLIKMADDFDRVEDEKSADIIENIIKVVAELEEENFEVEVPDDEMDFLREILVSFQNSMQKE